MTSKWEVTIDWTITSRMIVEAEDEDEAQTIVEKRIDAGTVPMPHCDAYDANVAFYPEFCEEVR